LRQHVGNYPGVTVELKKGTAAFGETRVAVVDLPGTYSLAARSPDEMVTIDFILGHDPAERKPDVVISVVDANNLERHLYLATQLMNLGVPLVLAANMTDVAEAAGITFDWERLRKRLGVRVIPIQANRGRGLAELGDAVLAAAEQAERPVGPLMPEALEREAQALSVAAPPFVLQRLLIDANGAIEKRQVARTGPGLADELRAARERLAAAGCSVPGAEARARYAWIREALTGCVERPKVRRETFSTRLDRVLTHRVWGTTIFLGLMFLVFQSIFVWAGPLMDLINDGKDALSGWIKGEMSPGPLRALLSDGIVNGVGSVLVFLPQIMILFAFIAILEDCGYMARAAFLMDRIMSRCGLNGKSFIPLLSSVACAVPGIMATRTIENRRDRLATILVAPLMSCSARLPVYMLLIAVFFSDPWWLPGVVLFGMYAVGLVVAPLVALALKRTLLRGATPLFVMELPSFKWPQLKTVIRRMVDAGWAFVRRAGTLIFASMILIWAALYYPAHSSDGKSFETETDQLESQLSALEKEKEKLEAVEENKDEERLGQIEQEIGEKEDALHQAQGEWKRNSYLGQIGRALEEPVFKPLGWDWRLGVAALASFPAREVVVGTLGLVYDLGEVDTGEISDSDNAADTPLGKAVRTEWSKDQDAATAKHPTAVALGLMVFFALCCQCVSTLAVIRRETGSWAWPLFTFVYMTTLAYLAALGVYQVGRLLG
jgi:ferrous iron transport protein B